MIGRKARKRLTTDRKLKQIKMGDVCDVFFCILIGRKARKGHSTDRNPKTRKNQTSVALNMKAMRVTKEQNHVAFFVMSTRNVSDEDRNTKPC